MKAYCIVIKGHKVSESGYETLKANSEAHGNHFKIERFDAVTVDTVEEEMRKYNIKWTWPDTGNDVCPVSGLRRHAYGGPPARRHACAMSHYLLWERCYNTGKPILILEHDAVFIQGINTTKILKTKYDIVGINDPRGNTRLYTKFHDVVQSYSKDEVVIPVPVIDNMKVPQGIAGNSAYIIKPRGAEHALGVVDRVGLFPNDAILIQQLVPNIGVTRKYYTTCQDLPSTTFTNV